MHTKRERQEKERQVWWGGGQGLEVGGRYILIDKVGGRNHIQHSYRQSGRKESYTHVKYKYTHSTFFIMCQCMPAHQICRHASAQASIVILITIITLTVPHPMTK